MYTVWVIIFQLNMYNFRYLNINYISRTRTSKMYSIILNMQNALLGEFTYLYLLTSVRVSKVFGTLDNNVLRFEFAPEKSRRVYRNINNYLQKRNVLRCIYYAWNKTDVNIIHFKHHIRVFLKSIKAFG